MLPAGTKCPASAATSLSCRSARSKPCMTHIVPGHRTPGRLKRRHRPSFFSTLLERIGRVLRGPGCPVTESFMEPYARLGSYSYRFGLRGVAVLASVLGGRERAVLLGQVAVERRLFFQVGGKLLGGHQPEEHRTEHGLQS